MVHIGPAFAWPAVGSSGHAFAGMEVQRCQNLLKSGAIALKNGPSSPFTTPRTDTPHPGPSRAFPAGPATGCFKTAQNAPKWPDSGPIWGRLGVFGGLLGVLAFARAGRVERAMQCRGRVGRPLGRRGVRRETSSYTFQLFPKYMAGNENWDGVSLRTLGPCVSACCLGHGGVRGPL